MSTTTCTPAPEPLKMPMDGMPVQDGSTGHGAVGTTARLGTILCGVKFNVEVSGRLSMPFQAVRKPDAPGSTAVTVTANARTCGFALASNACVRDSKEQLGCCS